MMNRPTPARKRRGLRLLIAVALAATAAGGVHMYASSLQDQVAAQVPPALAAQETTASVLIARSDVPANVPLSPDLFEVKSLPQDAVAPGAVNTPDQLTGKVLANPMSSGEQLVATRLVNPSASPL
ncbi:MAG: hypothetical protein JOZ81_20260, partial [Chloroflexi bacterium]|nr:hypothetical protein [Chloroflexota bacterium]